MCKLINGPGVTLKKDPSTVNWPFAYIDKQLYLYNEYADVVNKVNINKR